MQQQPISTYYETDHDRLDELFRNFQQFKHSDYRKAGEFFKEFKLGLQRHIAWEEEILFPVFEEKTGLKNGGPTHVMRLEHRQIKSHLEAIHEKVKQNDPGSDSEEQLLLQTLLIHNQKEERILYPAIDSALDESERTKIYRKMDNLLQENYR